MTLYTITIFIIFFTIPETYRSCAIYNKTVGVTSPSQDIFLRNGSSLVLNCTLYPKNFPSYFPQFTSSKNIIFYLNNTKLVPKSQIHVLDKYTAQLKIDNISESDGGFYNCFIRFPKTKDQTRPMRDNFVCGNLARIGVPPQLIKNEDFNCISSNWQNMTCSWKQPYNQIPTKYELFYSFPLRGRRSKESKCPTYKTKTSCFFGSDVKKQQVVYKQSAKYFIFRLKGSNIFGDSSKLYPLRHFTVVLPNKPVDFRTTSVSKDSLILEWKSPLENDLFPPGLDYELRYRSTWDKPNEWKIARTKEKKLELKHLSPHTWYTMKLRCKSKMARNEEKWWSKFSKLTILTDSDVPRRAPGTVSGMYETNWFENNKRAVTIYWEPLAESEWNGDNFTYEIWYFSEGTRSDIVGKGGVQPFVIKTKKFFTKILNMEAERSYTLAILSSNSVGLKPGIHSKVHVQRRSLMPDKPRNILAKLLVNGSYSISWKASKGGRIPVKSFTVFWCKRHMFDRCDKPLEWVEVSGNQTNVLVDASGDKNSFYNFAVSSNSETASSGMIWAVCLISANEAPGKIQQLRAAAISSTQLKISWKLGCMQESNSIKGYYIHDCISVDSQTCSEPMNKQFVKQKKFLLINREPYSVYRVTVSSVSMTNEESDPSEPYMVQMPEGIPGPPSVLRLVNTTHHSISLKWNQPDVTNGVVRYYLVNYNRHSIKIDFFQEVTLRDYIKPYELYQVSVSACTNKGCSTPSAAINVTTEIAAPSKMGAPRFEIINVTHVKVSWDKPESENGPLDSCQLSIKLITDTNDTQLKSHTFTPWQNGSIIFIECSSLGEEGKDYKMAIRAGNLLENYYLYGQWSEGAKVKMCVDVAEAMEAGLVIGVTIGCTMAVAMMVLIINYMLTRAKKRMEEIHKVNIQLPKGLGEVTKKSMCSLTHLAAQSHNNQTRCVENHYIPDNVNFESKKKQDQLEDFGSISAQMSFALDKTTNKNVICKHLSSIALMTQSSHQSTDSGIPSESEYYGSPLPSPDNVFYENNKQDNGKCSSNGCEPVSQEDDINNNSHICVQSDDIFDAEKKQNMTLDLLEKSQIGHKNWQSEVTKNTDAFVGFALMNHNCAPFKHDQFCKADDPVNPKNGLVGTNLNRLIAGSESNLADADSGHGSDTNNDNVSSSSLCHYAYFGLSNSYTDVTGNKENGNHPALLSGSGQSNEDMSVISESSGKKFANYKAPYSKFGLLNTYVKLAPFQSVKANAQANTKESYPGYITMEDMNNHRPADTKKIEHSNSDSSEDSQDEILVFSNDKEHVISSPNFPFRQRIHRDSGVSVSSPTPESAGFSGYVPNCTFSSSPTKKKLDYTKSDAVNNQIETSDGYVPADEVIKNFETETNSLAPLKIDTPANGYIRHEFLLKANGFLNGKANAVESYNTNQQQSIWV